MASSDKILDLLLELSDPNARRTRPEQIDHALRTSLLLTDADAVAVLSPTSRRGERLVLHTGSAAPATVPPPPESSVVVARLAESCQPLNVVDLTDEPEIAASDGCPGVELGPALYTPLRQRDPVPGYIAAYRRRGRARFTPNDSRQMLMLSAWLSIALENLRVATGMERLAITDDLTDVYNSRFVQTALRRELRRASRFEENVSVALIDVDSLEAFKELHGAPRAGLLIRELATLLSQQMRSFDLMGRHGSEGFLAVLPQTGTDGALEVAERMRSVVETHAFPPRNAGAVTVSVGVASFPSEGTEAKALIERATSALKGAQQRGKNRVRAFVHRAA